MSFRRRVEQVVVGSMMAAVVVGALCAKRKDRSDYQDEEEGPEASAQIGGETVNFVSALAAESFKRQVDLDESVWRSLPFIAATFAFVAAVVGKAATDVPAFGWSTFSTATNLLFGGALLSLAWTLRWFWIVLRKREYEYPADDASVVQYARDMTAYHAALGLTGELLDTQVVEELRHFMVDQYGSAARTNLRLNAVRLEARSKVLLFILVGFVLAFLCEATIFVHRELYGLSEVHSGEETGQRPCQSNRKVGGAICPADGAGAISFDGSGTDSAGSTDSAEDTTGD